MITRCAALALLLSGCGVDVTVDFTATVISVSDGAPFGLTQDDVEVAAAGEDEGQPGTAATGSFGWYSDNPDAELGDPDVGVYNGYSDAPFDVSFNDQELEGQGNGTITIRNTDPDRLEFADGLNGHKPGDFMLLNGDETDDVGVKLALQHASGVFEDDYLPESFPGEPEDWSGELTLTYRAGSVTLRVDSVE